MSGPEFYQHGDVLLVRISDEVFEAEKAGAKCVENGVIQWGEATGHAHKIAQPDLAKKKARL